MAAEELRKGAPSPEYTYRVAFVLPAALILSTKASTVLASANPCSRATLRCTLRLMGEHVRVLAASKAENYSLTSKASFSPTCACTGILIFSGCTSTTICQALVSHVLSCKPYELSSMLVGQVS